MNFKNPDIEIIKNKKLFIFDMDGTIYLGGVPFEFAKRFIKNLRNSGKKVLFFTNNASHTSSFYFNKLSKLGFDPQEDEIMTSGDVTREFLLAYKKDKTVYMVATEELVEALFASVSDPGGITESDQATPPTYFSAQTRACMHTEAPKMPYRPICEAQGSAYPPRTANAAQGLDFEPILPRRFAPKTLQPLYNSLENALNIFRKTGKSATMTRAEGEDGIFITIHIPR